jgi:hypothetical protein
MRIYELFLEDQPPGIGRPVNIKTKSQSDLSNQPASRTPDRYKWQIMSPDGKEIYHKFRLPGITSPYDLRSQYQYAEDWLKVNLPEIFNQNQWKIALQPSRMANVGQGAYKQVRQHPVGQEIVKREIRSGGDTGGTAWLKAVVNYNRRNPLGNPWLPVITEIRTKTDPQGQVRTQSSEMSLEDGATLSPEAILSFATRIFPNFEKFVDYKFQKLLQQNDISQQEYDDRFANNHRLWKYFVLLINVVLGDPLSDVVPKSFALSPDVYMKRALQMAKNLEKKGHTFDVHPGNVMVRNTGRGWQPVLTDPLS